MEANFKDTRYYVDLIRRRWRPIIAVGVIGTLLAGSVAFLLPSMYRSSATVLIEEPEVPRDIVQSTVSGYADQRIQSISQRVMTTPKLIGLLEKYDLYANQRAEKPITEVVETFREASGMELVNAEVRDPRTGRPSQATIAFTLYFEHETPRVAQQVANELVSHYLAENLIDRQKKAAETTSFLDEETQRLGADIKEMEVKIAEFKKVNAGRLPEQLAINMAAMERAARDGGEIERQIQSLLEQRRFIESEMIGVDRFSTYLHDGEPVQNASERLKAAVAKYTSLKGVYGDAHPDMIKLRREIESLSAIAGTDGSLSDMSNEIVKLEQQLAGLKERYGDAHPEVVQTQRQLDAMRSSITDGTLLKAGSAATSTQPDNPVYLQLRARLKSVDLELEAARSRQDQVAQSLADYETRVLAAPEVERQYKILMRDYENAQIKYLELKDKQLEAELSQALESDRKSERFTLIEPPQLPTVPERPNRPLLLLLGFVAAFGGGLGYVFLADSLDRTVRGADQLFILTGETPLVSVPTMGKDSAGRRAARLRRTYDRAKRGRDSAETQSTTNPTEAAAS